MANDFKLKYGGELNQLDATTLIHSMISITAILQEINKEIAPQQKIDIKVNTPERGSFILHLSLQPAILEALTGLFKEKSLIEETVTTLAALIELARFLRGKRPEKVIKEEDNSVVVINNNGSTINVTKNTYNLYSGNVGVRKAIKDNFETLERDTTVQKFSVTDNNEKPFVEIQRDEFRDIASLNEMEDYENKIKREKAFLTILKIVFDRERKWEFYYNGIKISAYLEDEDFIKRIDAGEPFAKGDNLYVELEIEQILDKSANAWANAGYIIRKVIEHKPRSSQMEM